MKHRLARLHICRTASAASSCARTCPCPPRSEPGAWFERSVASEIPDVVRCLHAFGETIHQVCFEAGTLTQHLTYGLQEAGYVIVCMEARQVSAALSAMRNKTDEHDAREIAQLLRSGWYSRLHVESIESHHTRALLTSRKAMQRNCIDLKNRDPRPLENFRCEAADAALQGCLRRHRQGHHRRRLCARPFSLATARSPQDRS
ncbi:transposase [Mesorhizobium sp. M0045]|uniref:IS110 family transposase n=1 Tax=Mesorhizobium sp. M0045 TaxID=2956857 RepID=UPI00333B4640